MMRALLAALLVLIPALAQANECQIQFALAEQIGPPKPTSATISVIPYDSNSSNGRLAACAATDANKDVLMREGINPASPPGGVICSGIDSTWSPAERVDLVISGLSANTRYHYKVLCDHPDPNPMGLWGARPMRSFITLATEDADQDFGFTYEADPHYGTILKGAAPKCNFDGSWGTTTSQVNVSWRNIESALAEMARRRRTFHVNVGDYYQTDGDGTIDDPESFTSCPRSAVYSPVIAAEEYANVGGITRTIPIGTYMAQVPGFPARDVDGCDEPLNGCLGWSRNVQQTAVDANVKARARWNIWKIHQSYNMLFGYVPLVLAWGNHDNPKWPAFYDDLGPQFNGCVGQFTNDGQGTPKVAWEHVTEAWNELTPNPAGSSYYQPQPIECDPSGSPFDPPCNTLGHYYRFAAGKAEFWVINPFEGSGGLGNPTTSTGWDLTGQSPSTPNDWSLGAAQWNWLSTTFAASNAKWKFIMTHHPVGGVDGKDQTGDNCYWYARGGAFSTEGLYCDANNDNDRDAGEKNCSFDDTLGDLNGDTVDDGYDEAQDNRPALWKASWGACPDGVQCKSPISPFMPAPWANRTAAMAGNNANGGQQSVQSLMANNIDSGGASFMLLGHDHTTAAGCKAETDGCSDVWYITGSQPMGGGDGGNWSRFYRFGQWFDYNNDGLPDYRTDGAPTWPGPVDEAAGTIRQAGSERRGFFDVAVSDEGVKFDFIQTNIDIFPSEFGTTVFSLMYGAQSATETDFEGAASADSESKRAAEAPAVVGNWLTDYTGLVLEGNFSAQMSVAGVTSTLIADNIWTNHNGVTCTDLLINVEEDNEAGVASTGFVSHRLEASNTGAGGGLRIMGQGTNCPGGVGEGCFVVATRFSGGTAAATTSPAYTEDTTYMTRLCYDGGGGTTDIATVKMDACDPDDDNCDGKHDITGAETVVPTWGGGSFYSETATGATPASTDGYRIGSASGTNFQIVVDAVGTCLHDPGEFKCGDGFE